MSDVRGAYKSLHTIVYQNSRAQSAPADSVTLRTARSMAEVRLRGGFILNTRLVSQSTGRVVEPFYAAADHTTPMLEASHAMVPVGPNIGPGNQHGIPRWLDYKAHELADDRLGRARLVLQAALPAAGRPILTRAFDLSASALQVRTTQYNQFPDRDVSTSLGEHYYFKLNHTDPADIRVSGRPLDHPEAFGRGALEAITSGRPRFSDTFKGIASVAFGDGQVLVLSAFAHGDQGLGSRLGMLAWQRPGTDSICFEPTVGYSGPDSNHGVTVPPHSGSVTLVTEVRAI